MVFIKQNNLTITSLNIKTMRYINLLVPFLAFITLSFFDSSSVKASPLSHHPQTDTAQKTYTCPMHPEIISDKPGKCPKCGMTLVVRTENTITNEQEKQSPEANAAQEHAQRVKTALQKTKKELSDASLYSCCVADPCDRCALDEQSCDCYNDVKNGKGVCSDCYAGWKQGKGRVKGVKPSQVKMESHNHKK